MQIASASASTPDTGAGALDFAGVDPAVELVGALLTVEVVLGVLGAA